MSEINKQESIEEAATKQWGNIHRVGVLGFIDGAKHQQNDCITFITELENQCFKGWSQDSINGYLTACMTIKQKYTDMSKIEKVKENVNEKVYTKQEVFNLLMDFVVKHPTKYTINPHMIYDWFKEYWNKQ